MITTTTINHPTPCPACGHCPTCGRGGYYTTPFTPWTPIYPYPWWGVVPPSMPTWTATIVDPGAVPLGTETHTTAFLGIGGNPS